MSESISILIKSTYCQKNHHKIFRCRQKMFLEGEGEEMPKNVFRGGRRSRIRHKQYGFPMAASGFLRFPTPTNHLIAPCWTISNSRIENVSAVLASHARLAPISSADPVVERFQPFLRGQSSKNLPTFRIQANSGQNWSKYIRR